MIATEPAPRCSYSELQEVLMRILFMLLLTFAVTLLTTGVLADEVE
ncbi:MAG: hypothetical protein IJD99_10775 [Clostridia bacterium]|nr:hypothetical protein [Clostridia bacterium]